MKLWQGRPPVAHVVESHQDRLRRLSGEVLQRYHRELKAEIADPNRVAAVYGEGFASAGARKQAEMVAQMAGQMLDTPNAMVTVITASEQQTIAHYSTVGDKFFDDVPLTQSYCKHVIGSGQELLIDTARDHPLVCDTHLAVDGVITSYLGVPIANQSGVIVGVLCVFDSKHRDWSLADVGMLTQLSVVLTRALPRSVNIQ